MYSIDFRRKVLSVRQAEGLSIAQVAKRFCVGVNSVFLWTKKLEPTLKRNKPATKVDMEALKQDIKEHPDSFYRERARRLKVSQTGVFHAMKRLKVTYKKKPGSSKGERRRTAILPKSG